MWMHANAGCREGRPRPRPATRCWHETALMVTESCRHTNQLGTSKKTKTYIITSKNKNLHYAAPECVTTQPDVDSIALRVLLEKMLYLIAPLDTNLLPLQAHGTTQTAGIWPAAQCANVPCIANPQGVATCAWDQSRRFDHVSSKRRGLELDVRTSEARPCPAKQPRTRQSVGVRKGAATEDGTWPQRLLLADHASTALRTLQLLTHGHDTGQCL